jgi:hypothetical protein
MKKKSFFLSNFLSLAIQVGKLVGVGLDFFPTAFLSLAILLGNLVGGVLLLFLTCFLGTMVFNSVVFVVVVSFFLVEDLVDGVVGLGLFPTSFSLTVFIVIFLVLDVLFFCIPIGVVSTSFCVPISVVLEAAVVSFHEVNFFVVLVACLVEVGFVFFSEGLLVLVG